MLFPRLPVCFWYEPTSLRASVVDGRYPLTDQGTGWMSIFKSKEGYINNGVRLASIGGITTTIVEIVHFQLYRGPKVWVWVSSPGFHPLFTLLPFGNGSNVPDEGGDVRVGWTEASMRQLKKFGCTVLPQPTRQSSVIANSAAAGVWLLSSVIAGVAAGLGIRHRSSPELPPA